MRLFDIATYIFDPLHDYWENEKVHRRITRSLVFIFIAALAGIELKRRGLMPEPLASATPENHFYAVELAFTLVLVMEVISLIFALPCSVSKSVGKQFEILALILLRSSFKELVHFPEPVRLDGNMDALYRIFADGAGALAIFLILGVYYMLHKKRPVPMSGEDRYAFVASKKIVALMLLFVFAGMGLDNCLGLLTGTGAYHHFFAAFYTILIFCDILLVLISQQYLPAFHAVLRNSGYALSTLILRLSLTAPAYYNALIGVAAALFALALTLIYNSFYGRAQSES